MTALVMEHEQADGIALPVEQAGIQYNDAACRQAEIGQARVQYRTRIRTAQRPPRNGNGTVSSAARLAWRRSIRAARNLPINQAPQRGGTSVTSASMYSPRLPQHPVAAGPVGQHALDSNAAPRAWPRHGTKPSPWPKSAAEDADTEAASRGKPKPAGWHTARLRRRSRTRHWRHRAWRQASRRNCGRNEHADVENREKDAHADGACRRLENARGQAHDRAGRQPADDAEHDETCDHRLGARRQTSRPLQTATPPADDESRHAAWSNPPENHPPARTASSATSRRSPPNPRRQRSSRARQAWPDRNRRSWRSATLKSDQIKPANKHRGKRAASRERTPSADQAAAAGR